MCPVSMHKSFPYFVMTGMQPESGGSFPLFENGKWKMEFHFPLSISILPSARPLIMVCKARDAIGSDIIAKSSKRPAVCLLNDMA